MRADRLGILAALLALVTAVAADTPVAEAQTVTLKVMTWNIHAEDPGHLAEVIEAAGADVVALQEVDAHRSRSGCVHQAEEIAEDLGMTALFGANIESGHECGGGEPALYGDALLTRYPVLSWGHELLPNQGGEQRGLLEAVLDVGGRPVRIVSTHLEYGSSSERKAQAEAVVDHLEGATEPTVVMGDLNGEPNDSGLAPLRAAFSDAWAEAGTGDGYTNPSRAPRRRIDYVFFRGASPAAVEVLDSRASDHLAVRADLTL